MFKQLYQIILMIILFFFIFSITLHSQVIKLSKGETSNFWEKYSSNFKAVDAHNMLVKDTSLAGIDSIMSSLKRTIDTLNGYKKSIPVGVKNLVNYYSLVISRYRKYFPDSLKIATEELIANNKKIQEYVKNNQMQDPFGYLGDTTKIIELDSVQQMAYVDTSLFKRWYSPVYSKAINPVQFSSLLLSVFENGQNEKAWTYLSVFDGIEKASNYLAFYEDNFYMPDVNHYKKIIIAKDFFDDKNMEVFFASTYLFGLMKSKKDSDNFLTVGYIQEPNKWEKQSLVFRDFLISNCLSNPKEVSRIGYNDFQEDKVNKDKFSSISLHRAKDWVLFFFYKRALFYTDIVTSKSQIIIK